MYKNSFQLFAITVFLCFTVQLKAQSEKYSLRKADSWIVFDGMSSDINYKWIAKMRSFKRVGFILNLHYDDTMQRFYHESEASKRIDFNQLCDTLMRNIQDKNCQYAILFDVNEKYIPQLNTIVVGMDEKLHQKPSSPEILLALLNQKKTAVFLVLR